MDRSISYVKARQWLMVRSNVPFGLLLLLAGAQPAFARPVTQTAAQRPLIFLAEDNDPPLSYTENGVPRGRDIDLANALGAAMGRSVQIELMNWEDADRRIRDGSADAALSVSISDSGKAYDFTEPVSSSQYAIFVRSGELRIHGLEDLAGRKVGFIGLKSVAHELLISVQGVQLVQCANYADAFPRLARGEIDAFVTNLWLGAYWIQLHNFSGVSVEEDPVATISDAIAIRKGNPELLGSLNHAIETLTENGTIASIEQKWRPQEVVFLSRQRARSLLEWAVGITAVLLVAALTLWIALLRRNIGNRKRLERALQEAQEKYRQLVEHVPAISYLAEAGCMTGFVYISPQVETILGYPVEECLKDRKFWWNHVQPADRDLLRVEDTSAEGRPFTMEYRMQTETGRDVWLRDQAVIFIDPVTATRMVRGVIIDISEIKHAEQQLRTAQQLEALGTFAAGIAHDFNNILGIIMGYAELSKKDLEGRTRDRVEQIHRTAERGVSLTRQLLAFSRKQVLQPQALNLNEVVTDIKTMLSHVLGEQIDLITDLHTSLVPVKVDLGQMEQVLMNLAVNARDAMEDGGEVLIQTSNVDLMEEESQILEVSSGHFALLQVSDSGVGMSRETLARIFQPFFTTKPKGKGTGLGLATVYGIVKQSGGAIKVESELNHGTVFRIYLPAAKGMPGSAKPQTEEAEALRGTETIMLVEDQLDLRATTRAMLEDYGYRVLEACGAEQALKAAQTFAEPIHLLLTDVVMPGLNGRQVAEKFLVQRPGIRILYMTGYSEDVDVDGPGSSAPVLQKPFSRSELSRAVRAVLDRE